MNSGDPDGTRCAPDTGASADLKGLLIDFSDLLPGDILLFRSIDQKKHQQKISAATGSRYTHAAIYLGNHEIAESNYPKVQIRKLSDADKEKQVIGVLRSQCGFSEKRAADLRTFVKELIERDAGYDWRGALTFEQRRSDFVVNLLNNLAENYGNITTNDQLTEKSYFCSALVVACYIVAGIIDNSAQVAYKPDVFSPGDLHGDPTFGWFLGYITKEEKRIEADDPLLSIMLWKDIEGERWWQ
jgi:hypothetical protein